MARFALVAFFVTAAIAGSRAASPLEFGMEMGDRAYEAVCWYENLKHFPETHRDEYNKCSHATRHIPKEVTEPDQTNKEYFEFYPDKKETWYGERVPNQMGKLPKEYKSNCEKYLKDPKADPPADESDALNDGGNEYPYKGFAYCMMQTLRKKHGNEAIEAVKSEKTHSKKFWMDALLDRENEFRAHHGVDPLELVEDLTNAAQHWADDNAKNCKMQHSKGNDTFRQWNGAGTGESLSSGSGDDESDIAAYAAADGWYEEIKNYPYPKGYQGPGSGDPLFKKIGHFTQSVWKGSKYVGYGYAYNKNCPEMKRFVAARYSPAGNVRDEYPNNVLMPKSK